MLSVNAINQLAPDAASLKAGREQGKPTKWLASGIQNDMVWGEIQGSGKAPYRTAVDLRGPAYHCSCPSRKFPCKHSLGLLFVAAEAGLATAEPPAWVVEWNHKRTAAQEKKAAPEQAPTEADSPERAAERELAAAKRAARRNKLASEGLAQLQLWLEDLLGQGLAWVQAQPDGFWQDAVARLTNTQLGGIARMVEDSHHAAHSGDGWAARLLAELSRLHLLCRASARVDALDEAHAAELRLLLGAATSRDVLLARDGVRGTWQVLVRIFEVSDALRTYRHWLWCQQTGQLAQVFEFAAGAQPLDTSLPAGATFDGELVFYPGRSLRALIKTRTPTAAPLRIPNPPEEAALQSVLDQATALWAVQPWLRHVPALFKATPRADLGGFVDHQGRFLAWPKTFANAWQLLALSGGRPLTVFGELQASGFAPMTAIALDPAQRWVQRFER